MSDYPDSIVYLNGTWDELAAFFAAGLRLAAEHTTAANVTDIVFRCERCDAPAPAPAYCSPRCADIDARTFDAAVVGADRLEREWGAA